MTTLKQKKDRYKKTEYVASGAVTSTRFASNDEIYYNIASTIKYLLSTTKIYFLGRSSFYLLSIPDQLKQCYGIFQDCLTILYTYMAQILGSKTLKMDHSFEIHHYPHLVDKKYILSNLRPLSAQI